MPIKILILGSTGTLGKELVDLFNGDKKYSVTTWSHKDIDVTDILLLNQKIKELSPEYILNTVAYNSVDDCEDDEVEYAKAILLNKDVPEAIAKISKELGITFVHYSTDYVFGKNEKIEGGFSEDIIPIPNCKYAVSKYLGEEAVKNFSEKFYIIRLSRLFSKQRGVTGKKSFFEVMLHLSHSQKSLNVVDDEISCFTYAPDLAKATKSLIEDKCNYGIYHLINEGEESWYQGLRLLFKIIAHDTEINPIHGNAILRNAKRPAFSVLKNTKRPVLHPLKEALKDFVSSNDFIDLK
ncbi:TPA: hypothetical protein DEP94_02700 [Candidatus Nomurabacteria bacterium]|nr:hypothetical protein [Candidatus Nomurabacteria bacterium]